MRVAHGSPPAARTHAGPRTRLSEIIAGDGRRDQPAFERFRATSVEVSELLRALGGRYPRQVVIVSIGDLVLDVRIVPQGPLQPDDDTPATITIGGGGQAANFCAWTAALGEPARLVTRVGDDESGRRLVADIESRGVEVRAVWSAEPTGAIAVLVGPDGHRTMAT